MDAERNHHGGPWRCFHCDDVFTTVGAASDHFGPHPAATPGCVIDKILPEGGTNTQRGLGLLMALRKAELELDAYRQEDTLLHREMHRLRCEHQQALLREEEKGYARGLRDGANLSADSPERAALTCGVNPSRGGEQGCPKAAHCWDRFDCIAKGNCETAAGVGTCGGSCCDCGKGCSAEGVGAGGEAWELAARDVVSNPRPVEEIRHDIAAVRERIAGVPGTSQDQQEQPR